MDVELLSYVLAADETPVAVFLVGWVSGIVCWSLLARVMTK